MCWVPPGRRKTGQDETKKGLQESKREWFGVPFSEWIMGIPILQVRHPWALSGDSWFFAFLSLPW